MIGKGSPASVVWLAGLLEGEGTFLAVGSNKRGYRPRLQLKMTDRDVVQHAASILRYKNKIYTGQPTNKDWKRWFLLAIEGDQAVLWMLRLLPLMGKRRRKQIMTAIRRYGVHRKFVLKGEVLASDGSRRELQ